MNNTNDGGPAFPELNVQKVGDVAIGESRGGMSRLDYFAAHATDADIEQFQGKTACFGGGVTYARSRTEARLAYAHAMIAIMGEKPSAREREVATAVESLVSVLCDPEGNVCIEGSDADRKIINDALEVLKNGGGA